MEGGGRRSCQDRPPTLPTLLPWACQGRPPRGATNFPGKDRGAGRGVTPASTTSSSVRGRLGTDAPPPWASVSSLVKGSVHGKVTTPCKQSAKSKYRETPSTRHTSKSKKARGVVAGLQVGKRAAGRGRRSGTLAPPSGRRRGWLSTVRILRLGAERRRVEGGR